MTEKASEVWVSCKFANSRMNVQITTMHSEEDRELMQMELCVMVIWDQDWTLRPGLPLACLASEEYCKQA